MDLELTEFENTFQNGLDYNFFSDLNEVAAVDTTDRDLVGSEATISFEYEDGFADGTDFDFASHVESIDERIDNRLISNFGLITEYGPVNEVFRIFNETTGEVYQTTRISGKQVYFSASTSPNLITVEREGALFADQIQDQIVITDELSVSGNRIFKVELTQTDITAATGDYIGSSFNSSIQFSDSDVFILERYFDPNDSETVNTQKLSDEGDYLVDYNNGIAYVLVSSTASTDIGDATYNYGKIDTRNNHITEVSNVYRSTSPQSDNTETFTISDIGDELISISDLGQVGETTVNDSAIQVKSGTSGDSVLVSSDVYSVRHIFQVTDLDTSTDPVDFAEGSTVLSSNTVVNPVLYGQGSSISSSRVIVLDSQGVPVLDSGSDGSGLVIQSDGSRKFVEVERITSIVSGSTQLAVLTDDTSDSTFLQRTYYTTDTVTGVNYFVMGSDGSIDASSNKIYLPTGVKDSAIGRRVDVQYRAKLLGGAAVLVDYSVGDVYTNYVYLNDEIIISYEYGDNVLDWSISDALSEGEEYYVSYKYGALRNSLRDNFGVLTGVEELTTAPTSLEREMYRSGLQGTLQSFLTGPTVPAIKSLVEAFTNVTPDITESVFLEWILGRDYLYLLPMELNGTPGISDDPGYDVGKFGEGLLLSSTGQTATIPATSNLRMSEGTWESFVVPRWSGVDNDATLTFNITFDGYASLTNVFIGASNQNPQSIPFSLNKNNSAVLGRPTLLHSSNGYFIWYDTTYKQWHVRMRGPISEERVFVGTITTTGDFNDVDEAVEVDGYGVSDGYDINEINDLLTSTDTYIRFSFTVDGYDSVTLPLDSYGDGYFAAFDGIDFQSDNRHYLFDTGVSEGSNRMSLFKDGKGFLRFRVRDANSRVKELSHNIKDWDGYSTYHVATSWKIGTIEQRDEMHLFVDGRECPNTYRFKGYLSVPSGLGVKYMDDAGETLSSAVTVPTIGGFDLITTAGSSTVTSSGASFITDSLQVGAQFTILDDTDDGATTQVSPYVYVASIPTETSLTLEIGPAGSGVPFSAASSLSDVKYSVNRLTLETVADPLIENVRVFAVDQSDNYTELRSPDALLPDYEFDRDGYQDYVVVNDGVPVGSAVVLLSYGLTQQRCIQLAYIWPHRQTNMLSTIMPQPTAVSKIKITTIIARRTSIEQGGFAVVATAVGGDLIQILSSNLDFCQPSNASTGRTLKITVSGSNFDFSGINQVILIGSTTDGYGSEIVNFSSTGSEITSRFFTSLTDVIANFTPSDLSSPAGSIEIRETFSITESENSGEYAVVRLSVIEQAGTNGVVTSGSSTLTDGYSRFGESDIGKTIFVLSPVSIYGPYTISNVSLDPSGTVKDSDTVTLSGTGLPWSVSSSSVSWQMLNTSYGDSGFANGLITLERYGTGGLPFLLSSCWYEVDFPGYLIIPWTRMPETLYTGSDIDGENQANAVIDELRLLDEMSLDTGAGETTPSSGRSITTDAQVVSEYSPTVQTLMLFHFNGCVANKASFYSSFSGSYFQSENSVNSLFGQSAIFNGSGALKMDNSGIFFNNEGTIEFWVSPILDTYNDPSRRYFIDLSPEQTVTATVISPFRVELPVRARSVSNVSVEGSDTNYFTGGSLSSDGITITPGIPIPFGISSVTVTYVPITNQGDRFSIFKDENGALVLLVTASGVDYQITTPVYWKKNTWHRVFVGWDLNNADNQDRLVMMADGSEGGIIRYGTGLRYGTGVIYGMPTVWGSATAGSTASRNILADINLTDFFSFVDVGGDFTGQFPAMARIDNMRFSNELRTITYLGGSGPGQLLGRDLLYTSNTNTAQPVISDALTTLLLDFDTSATLVENLISVHDDAAGIFDFFVDVIDSFQLVTDTDVRELIENLIQRLKPAHTRAFVDFGEDECP
jgi:hypothetical protein